MSRLRGLCIALGLANIVAGVLAWPLGFGKFAGHRALIQSNYRSLVADGRIREVASDNDNYDHYSSVVIQGLEQRMSNESALTAALLVGQGCILAAAGLLGTSAVRPKSAS
jgi:hypothetical protein